MSATETTTMTGAVQSAPRDFPACPGYRSEPVNPAVQHLYRGRSPLLVDAMAVALWRDLAYSAPPILSPELARERAALYLRERQRRNSQAVA